MSIFTSRRKRQMEDKIRNAERREEKKQAKSGIGFMDEPAPPVLVKFQRDTGKMPAAFPIQLPNDTAIAAIHRGRTFAIPVGSFAMKPDLEVDEESLEHAGLDFAVV